MRKLTKSNVIDLIYDVNIEFKRRVKKMKNKAYHYSDNITLEDVYENLKTLIATFDNIPSELIELEQDIAYELDIEEEHPNECNRLIERAYELFDKYIV